MAKTIKKETVLAVIRGAERRGVALSPKELCRKHRWDAPARQISRLIDGLVADGFAKFVTRTDGSGKQQKFVVAV